MPTARGLDMSDESEKVPAMRTLIDFNTPRIAPQAANDGMHTAPSTD